MEISEWFEKKYLEWQLENGRASLDEFAKLLRISRGYLSQILNGDKETIGLKSALMISNILQDDSLLDILGYPRPDYSPVGLDSLPEEMRNNLVRAIGEIRETFKNSSVDPSSPEGERISVEILKRYGFIFNTNLNE